MRGMVRLIEVAGVVVLVLVLAVVGSRVLVDEDPADASGVTPESPPKGQVIDSASVVESLRASGLTVQPEGKVDQPFLSVSGQVLTVSGENVQVFEYPDAASAEADAARISPDGSQTGLAIVDWIGPPHFFRKDRLLVLHVGESDEVDSVLSGILGAQFAGR